MLTLASKLKKEEGVRGGGSASGSSDPPHRVSIRDRLLIKDEGYYQGGKFQFEIDVPEAYNMVDLLNFDDPLNIDAAEHHLRDKDDFRCKVQDFIKNYAR
ncbi:NEDD8-conjugating enzyme UBE2F [Bagarius yarrelli]|uniref:NEDD8-conjugating enzyme UBE2F n=1 Tax=Bagarius yarrelli TaxID=175774 RepID=A0A556VL01_BAGYA|nr:NEDD8-conjugating enzyme UBE2F [Bagarius yarrelli]